MVHRRARVVRMCVCVCIGLCGCVFFLYSYMLLGFKYSLVSKTASELARSSSVDVLHVRLGVYALSSIVVSESRIQADRKLLPS